VLDEFKNYEISFQGQISRQPLGNFKLLLTFLLGRIPSKLHQFLTSSRPTCSQHSWRADENPSSPRSPDIANNLDTFLVAGIQDPRSPFPTTHVGPRGYDSEKSHRHMNKLAGSARPVASSPLVHSSAFWREIGGSPVSSSVNALPLRRSKKDFKM